MDRDLGSHLAPHANGLQRDPFALDTGAPLALGVYWILIWGPIWPQGLMVSEEAMLVLDLGAHLPVRTQLTHDL